MKFKPIFCSGWTVPRAPFELRTNQIKENQVNKTALTTCFAISIASAVIAQAQMPGPPGRGGFGHEVRMLGIEGGHPGTVVTGAPFSGQEVTTETQTLTNGTHIQHTNTAQFYRDAEGRTRIEHTFSGFGPLAGGAPKTTIEIFDPVAAVAYFLNPAEQTATKSTLPTRGTGRTAHTPHQNSEDVTTSLGTQTIQGVPCTGTQTVRTIPAGQIGNDQAITITTQRWYSADLQLTLQSKRNDPRMGEVDSQFQNVSRTAPDPTLFQVPSSYTVTTKAAGRFHGPSAPTQ
jgi:hypothetical protein